MSSALFAPLLSQHARLLEIRTALPEAALLVERFSGREAVSESFRFEIDCLSTNAHFDLRALLNQEVTLLLLLADGSKRAWHGYVTQVMQLGSDGGLARYRLVAESFLAFLALRHDCYLFQDKTVLDIVGQVLADHPQANWSHQVTQPLRTYSITTQYRESDLTFLRRLLAEEGLSFRFIHDQTACAGDEAHHARHQWLIFDRHAPLPDSAPPSIRFHRSHATEASDTLTHWQETNTAPANAVTLAGWDYKTLVATGAEALATDPGDLPRLEIHEAATPYRFEQHDAAQLRAGLQLAAHASARRRFAGAGTVRSLAEGTVFTLTQHAAHSTAQGSGQNADDRRFTVLAVEHHGANNLGAQAAKLLACPDVETGSYRNTLCAQPAAADIVPLPLPQPVAGPQPALVVGLPGQVLTTERDHRIKIQFHWQRGDVPNPGGFQGEALPGKAGNAPGNEQAGAWVRVAEWLAGPNWGSHFLPRIGTEVLVDFLDADINRPVIAAQLHNGADSPPFSAGHDAPANHPGVLAGWMSHNHQTGHNQWVADDAPGQLRTRLASSEHASQLSLGHLIHHAPESATRGPWRGSGFEWRTDGWLALRAGEGILISATSRPDARSTQMDMAEALAQLKAAAETAQQLSDAAQHQHALPLSANNEQTALLRVTDPQQDGKYTAPAGGQPTVKHQPGSRQPDEPAERFAEPLILAEAPADIALSSPASTLLFASTDFHATVQKDLHLAAAHTLALTSGQTASGFAYEGGIKSIAQAGSHTIQAHTSTLEILADQAITVTSTHDEIHLYAKDKIELRAGQASVTLQGPNITFACPGKFSVKGIGHAFLGPERKNVKMEKLPSAKAQAIPPEQWKTKRKHPVSR